MKYAYSADCKFMTLIFLHSLPQVFYYNVYKKIECTLQRLQVTRENQIRGPPSSRGAT